MTFKLIQNKELLYNWLIKTFRDALFNQNYFQKLIKFYPW